MQIHFHFKQALLYRDTQNTINLLCVYLQLGPSSSCAAAPTEKLLLFMCTQLLKIAITTALIKGSPSLFVDLLLLLSPFVTTSFNAVFSQTRFWTILVFVVFFEGFLDTGFL